MNLNHIFNPKTVAIVGASTRPGTVGNDLVKNLANVFKGSVYPVNPKATELYGLKCYANLQELPEVPELVIIAVPAEFVPQVVDEAGRKGARGAVVISAGFKEAGRADLENAIIETARKYDMALIGPNCLGIVNPAINLNASFAAVAPGAGAVAFVSQSGALCTAVIDYAKKLGIGFSKFMSVGNKAVVAETEILEYLAKDEATKVIAMYVESLRDAKALIEVAKKITTGANAKPIIVIKSGRTAAGASASASHTGALAGNDAAYDALFAQAGILRAENVLEMFEYLRVFSANVPPQGNRVAIVTNAGGPGVLATDEAVANGLVLAKLSKETEKNLTASLPTFANVHNPVDVLGDAKADRYAISLENLVKDKNVDSIVVLLTPQAMTDIRGTAEAVVAARQKTDKQIVVSFMGGKMVYEAVQHMSENHVATIAFPEQAMRALAALTHFANGRKSGKTKKVNFSDVKKEKVAKIFSAAKARGQKSFPEIEANDVMRAYGFKLPKSGFADSSDVALKVAKKIGGKMVMKIVSPQILHKSDVGGVMLNITAQNIKEKFAEMMKVVKKRAPKAEIKGVLLVEMVEFKGAEMILGVSKDPALGHMLMVGLGGVMVEVFRDVAFGLSPIDEKVARAMVEKLKSAKILAGVRGKEKLDSDALIEAILRLAQLVTDFPEIIELDINPLMVLPKGTVALDARIVIE